MVNGAHDIHPTADVHVHGRCFSVRVLDSSNLDSSDLPEATCSLTSHTSTWFCLLLLICKHLSPEEAARIRFLFALMPDCHHLSTPLGHGVNVHLKAPELPYGERTHLFLEKVLPAPTD